ncbi:formate dehydrogenase accessory sulfurtransferase FdhD [Paracoccaceae bacterium GXU_MW_L88]
MLDKSDKSIHSPYARGRVLTAEGGNIPTGWYVSEEMPVAILTNGQRFAVMMATPADLEDFALGFALSEGLVPSAEVLTDVKIAEAADGWLVNLKADPEIFTAAEDRRRRIAGRSGCGICGAQSLDAAVRPARAVTGARPTVAAILRSFDALREAQEMKALNHSVHGAALCNGSGEVRLIREDIGRHNALDKLIGGALRAGGPKPGDFVTLSSRVSVEMVQKAATLGTPLLAAISPPSALALRLAADAGLAIAARAKGDVMLFDPAQFGAADEA